MTEMILLLNSFRQPITKIKNPIVKNNRDSGFTDYESSILLRLAKDCV